MYAIQCFNIRSRASWGKVHSGSYLHRFLHKRTGSYKPTYQCIQTSVLGIYSNTMIRNFTQKMWFANQSSIHVALYKLLLNFLTVSLAVLRSGIRPIYWESYKGERRNYSTCYSISFIVMGLCRGFPLHLHSGLLMSKG